MALSAYNSGSPTATGTTTTWANGQTLGYADSVLAHYGELGGAASSTAAELAAESGENLASVNSLSNAYNASPYTATSASDAGALPQQAQATPYTPIATYNQLSSSSQQLGASAVNTMADMIDEGDVFGGGGDDDGT